jgi:ABC-2 type transport system permease protein
LKLLLPVFKRQLASYFSSPATYLSIAIFLVLSASLGLHTSELLERNSSDLQAVFEWHPWLYLLLIPALSTQLWADEHGSGFGDLIKTMPIKPTPLVMGKFLAAWVVTGVALVLMFPMVMAVNVLGPADNMLIASQFLASWLLAGSYLSVGCFICVLTSRRLVIFLLTLSLLSAASGLASVLDALEHQAPIWALDSLMSLSPSLRFSIIDHGLLTLHESLYFISMMFAFLCATTITLNYKNS